MSNQWDDLPNARHIDFVLEHVKSHPNVWNIAWNAARNAAGEVAWNAAKDAAWEAARNAAGNAAWYAAKNAARDALISLIAYDDCAHLLYSDPKEVEVLAKLGVPVAELLLPACIAISMTKEENED